MNRLHYLAVLVCLLHPVQGVKYSLSWTPSRIEFNGTVEVKFSLEDYVKPVSTIYLMAVSSSGSPVGLLFRVENGNCQLFYEVYTTETIFCDNKNLIYEVRILAMNNSYPLQITAGTQSPSRSDLYHTYPYTPPRTVRITPIPSWITNTWREGADIKLKCEFIGGRNNYGNFAWTRLNTTLPTGAVVTSIPGSDENKYGNASVLAWRAKAGDDGGYQCESVYDPSSVGTFTDVYFVRVHYTPKLNMSMTYEYLHRVATGQNLTLSACIVANPAPNDFYWMLNDEYYDTDSSDSWRTFTDGCHRFSLNVIVTDKSYGTYQLSVGNAVGRSRIYFKVEKPASFEITPWVIAALVLIVVVVAMTVGIIVYCVVSGRKNAFPTHDGPRAQANKYDNPTFDADENVIPDDLPDEPPPPPPNMTPLQANAAAINLPHPPMPTPLEEEEGEGIYDNDRPTFGAGRSRLPPLPVPPRPPKTNATDSAQASEPVPEITEDESGYMSMEPPSARPPRLQKPNVAGRWPPR